MWTSEHQQRRCFAFGLIAVTTWGPSHHTIPPPPPPAVLLRMSDWHEVNALIYFFFCFLTWGKTFIVKTTRRCKNKKKTWLLDRIWILVLFFPLFLNQSYFSWASWLRRLVISKQKISLKGIWDESHFFLKLWKKKKSHNACWVLTDWIITGCVCVEILIMPLVFFCL